MKKLTNASAVFIEVATTAVGVVLAMPPEAAAYFRYWDYGFTPFGYVWRWVCS